MKLIFADDQYRDHLLPFVFTRPVSGLRIGILTIQEKWQKWLDTDSASTGFIIPHYLQAKFLSADKSSDALLINGAVLPDADLVQAVKSLDPGQALYAGNRMIAANSPSVPKSAEKLEDVKGMQAVSYAKEVTFINRIYDLFRMNDLAIRADFELLTKGRMSAPISPTNQVRNPYAVFLEEGAKMENCIINAETGPVYIAAGAEVMEGCIIRGPFSLGEHAALKMGAKVYGATTLGPGCKAGGEISNSVMMANSNKAHDGFLGNSVLGEWCNLGADTNNSNLKNNYGEVKLWNYALSKQEGTGLQFCGLFMGDHSKCAINTSFNTGTVVGVGANIFMHGFPPKYIPSFTWGGGDDSEQFLLDKMLELAEVVMKRRNILLTEADKSILSHLYLLQLHPQAED